MNLEETLRQHDPARDEPLREDEVRRLRAALDGRPPRLRARGATAAAFLILLIAVAAVFVSRRQSDRIASVPPQRKPAHTRQLQMTTPGGTRVVWVFNDNFSM